MGLAKNLTQAAHFLDRQVSPMAWQDCAKEGRANRSATQSTISAAKTTMLTDLWAPATFVLQGLHWTQLGRISSTRVAGEGCTRLASLASPLIFVGAAAGWAVRFIIVAASTVVLGIPWVLTRQLEALIVGLGALLFTVLQSGSIAAEGPSEEAIWIDPHQLEAWFLKGANSNFENPDNLSNVLHINAAAMSRIFWTSENLQEALTAEAYRAVRKAWQSLRDRKVDTMVELVFLSNSDDTDLIGFMARLAASEAIKKMSKMWLDKDVLKKPSRFDNLFREIQEKEKAHPLVVGGSLNTVRMASTGAAAAGLLWVAGRTTSYCASSVGASIFLYQSCGKLVSILSEYEGKNASKKNNINVFSSARIQEENTRMPGAWIFDE